MRIYQIHIIQKIEVIAKDRNTVWQVIKQIEPYIAKKFNKDNVISLKTLRGTTKGIGKIIDRGKYENNTAKRHNSNNLGQLLIFK